MQFLPFFFGEFHAGAVNQLLHFFGFAVLGYGAGVDSVWLMAASGPIMLAGNITNAIQGRYRREFWTTMPLQLAGWGGVLGLAYFFSQMW